MKTANRGGHNYQAPGASGYVNEVKEDRLINAAVIKWLKILGHNPNDVTPGNCDENTDLVYGVQMSNTMDADIFNSNHLNAHVTCQEAKGCECVTYGDAPSVEIANRVTDNLVKLGFKRRPNKVNKELYEVKATVAPSVIVEPFFVDSYADVQLYYKVGADAIGKAIAYGLVGKEFNNIIEEEIKVDNIVVYGSEIDKRGAEYLADKLQCSIISKNIAYDYSRIKNVYCVGGKQADFTSYCTKFIGGANRYETCQNVLDFIKTI